MTLTGLKREFLERLAGGPWASPPLFDHSLVARLVEAGLVQTETLPDGSVQYALRTPGEQRSDKRTRLRAIRPTTDLLKTIPHCGNPLAQLCQFGKAPVAYSTSEATSRQWPAGAQDVVDAGSARSI
jgi:hypothetical protein